ncbi:hypothetical protein IFT98_02310 [Pseudomonas sp. CFBP 8770]|uniref:hypothetical protein n=1 Tax=unclassified Pseudomonas TaxID=196821 RepID=UPI00177D4C21|nr:MULTISPECIES: hypothetical protein [unclassified Pseudomonas]MBD8473084.1 hypothetical protein [Pseudomonas sp. CFBP 8773]MBD8645813.1 hypothetical protein [Pseudomonas sp. CFBP 8770]
MPAIAPRLVLPAATPPVDIRPILSTLSTICVDSFVAEKMTYEVLGRYTTHNLSPVDCDYEFPQVGTRPAMQSWFELDPESRPNVIEKEMESLPDGVVDLDAIRSKRGPKPKIFSNPHASHFRIAHHEGFGWFDDYVYGACMTAGLVSNGTMNVSPSHVQRACMLEMISTEIVKSVIRLDGLRTMSDQQARRICQCARLAIGGMEFYLERNPAVQRQIKFEVDFADSYYQAQPVTQTVGLR